MFQNPEIALDSLPGMQDLDWHKLHPNYASSMRLQLLVVFLGIGVALAALSFVPDISPREAGGFWALFLTGAAVLLIWPTFSIPRRGYVLRDRDIVFRSGVIWRSITAVPFNRIQHVETSSTPFDRRYGLATLQLFTAGGSSGDLKIDGLGNDTAEQLRAFILDKAGATVESA